jgi:hypothetical protein
MEAKIEWKLTWHCCICCNPAKGRVDFECGWLIKSKESLSANQDQTPTKNKKKTTYVKLKEHFIEGLHLQRKIQTFDKKNIKKIGSNFDQIPLNKKSD